MFKKGDRVVFRDNPGTPPLLGTVQEVKSSRIYPYAVLFDGQTKLRYYTGFELAHVEEETGIPAGTGEHTPTSPAHYKWLLPHGLEVIDLTENLNFCRGNAVKYLCRAGRKDGAPEVQDLEKALWYIKREIQRINKENNSA
ncbi:DUF3310 domain-containing protein [Streptomyces sp. CFMR 7]|uniref:DUF3310 domain-containing protein n=1 Tax=Streptomyces sp. CFMR 7 TaxID=1649184 RepID=UPI00119F9C3E|nr:DUF3310 domain-containing protein [Streptomyces sp. CFMR 7]